jgi:hypothetical protein
MQILEILVFEDREGLFSEFSQFLPLAKVEQSHLPAFRLEIDRNLVLLIYCVDKNQNFSQEHLKNIFPHLSRFILLSDQQNFLNLNFSEDFQALYNEYDPFIASTIVLAGVSSERRQPAEPEMQPGYYLNKDSRLFFWNQDQPEDRNRIWQMMWE